MKRPQTGQPAPPLEFESLTHGNWSLADQKPETFTMLVSYRGFHCPRCKDYLQELTLQVARLRELGVITATISMDDMETTANAMRSWALGDFVLGYGLTEDQATQWGLYLSDAIGPDEPARFSEPGLFLVDREGKLFYAAINSAPYGRPDLEKFVESVGWLIDEKYPARGTAAA